MSQQYVATAKKATAVSKSLVCHFTGADDLNLVIAKGARLEIRDITPEGLQHRLDVPLYGAIATMEAYSLPEESSDRLFILTERYQFCVLQYDGARQVGVGKEVARSAAVQHARIHRSRPTAPVLLHLCVKVANLLRWTTLAVAQSQMKAHGECMDAEKRKETGDLNEFCCVCPLSSAPPLSCALCLALCCERTASAEAQIAICATQAANEKTKVSAV